MKRADREQLDRERTVLLERVEGWLELPMTVLGFVWLVFVVWDLTVGLPGWALDVQTAIWAVFIVDFLVRFTLAPRKVSYVRRNVLTLVSLAVPALRVFRIVHAIRLLQLAQATRGLRLVMVVGSLNRSMRALGRTMERRGFAYVMLLTVLVTVGGGAGMFALEPGLRSFGEAVWWTAMVMTTLASEFWPQTAEGRILALVLSVYAIGVFGYITATLASFFVDRDAEDEEGQVAGSEELAALREEIRLLRVELRDAGRGGMQ